MSKFPELTKLIAMCEAPKEYTTAEIEAEIDCLIEISGASFAKKLDAKLTALAKATP